VSLVLVTGGSGFIGSHCIAALLEAGHEVRTTIRSAGREAEVRQLLRGAGVEPGTRLSFAVADLERDVGWMLACGSCDYVLHVASPFPATVPRHEDDLIIPARDGALRLLRAAREANVKRVVLTSSYAAIGYGRPARKKPFDETTWTDLGDPGVSAYAKSKTVAERAAWDFMNREGGGLELAVVNPVGVFGPVLGADFSTSIQIVQRLLEGGVPANPKIYFGVVDVRDVVDLHLRCMTDPAARSERFLATAENFLSMQEVGRILRDHLGEAARRVPTWEIPNWVVRLAALRNPELRQLTPELGKKKNGSNAKARSLLGWAPRSNQEAILATAESLLRLGLVKAA
jgi:nucleoside-diphosphate-sugar epimerase